MKKEIKQKKSIREILFSLLINKYFWMILIPDLFIIYFIIKYSTVLFMAFLLNDPDIQTAGVVIALFIVKAIIDIIVSIKLIKGEVTC
jgi:hypothetical protein